MSHFISTSGAKVTDTVYFVIHRKASLLGALLPHRIFINGQFAGMLRSGKTICAAVPRGNAYYVDDVLSSGSLSDIIDALQVIGATQYATLILEIIQRDFCGVQFPLNEAQMTQMQAKLDRAEQEIGDAPGAYDEFRKAMARYMMARLNTSENIY